MRYCSNLKVKKVFQWDGAVKMDTGSPILTATSSQSSLWMVVRLQKMSLRKPGSFQSRLTPRSARFLFPDLDRGWRCRPSSSGLRSTWWRCRRTVRSPSGSTRPPRTRASPRSSAPTWPKMDCQTFSKRFLALTSYQQPETQVNRNYKPPTLQVLIYARLVGSNLVL